MDSIIDQMMTVAEYIGWETKELRPVSLSIHSFNYFILAEKSKAREEISVNEKEQNEWEMPIRIRWENLSLLMLLWENKSLRRSSKLHQIYFRALKQKHFFGGKFTFECLS